VTGLATTATLRHLAAGGERFDWRWPVYGLLLYLPVSGVPIVLSYPSTGFTPLLKDVLFVLPAYAAFLLARARLGWSFPGAPLLPLGAFAALVAVLSLPQLANPLVPLVGAKVWLFTVPLLFLGYHLPRSRSHLRRLLAAMTLVGLVPVVVGIVEAALLDGGRGDLVYPWYGQAAQAVTQNFFDAGFASDARFLRVPSLFSFAAQYYDFLSAMVVVTFAWRALKGGTWATAAFALTLVASLTCGVRAALAMTPLLVAMIVLISFSPRRARVSTVALGGTGLLAGGLAAVNVSGLLAQSTRVGAAEFASGFLGGLPRAMGITLTGLGTGYATGAARYALGGVASPAAAAGLNFSESWWVKVLLELGVAGLLAVVVLMGWLLVAGYLAWRRTGDRDLRQVAAALLAFLLWTLVYLSKGAEIDLDPINVYFWLFAGILLRLPALAGADD
jgi:hypothetical protein